MNLIWKALVNKKILFGLVLVFMTAGYGCDSKTSKSPPPPAGGKTCSSTSTGGKLSLQSTTSKTLLVGYDKASENGKDVSSTYSIKALMTKHCVSCHKAGGKAEEILLTSYSQVKKAAKASLEQVEKKEMPQGKESDAELIRPYLKAWINAGTPQAQPTKAAATSSSTNTKTSTSSSEDLEDSSADDTSSKKPVGTSGTKTTGC